MRDLRFLFRPRYATSRALVIGINAYANASPLSYAVSDARSIHELLIEQFFFPPSEVVLIEDEQATKKNILRLFLQFSAESVGLDDRLVVFFAGHGHTKTGARGEVGFLVPYDADLADPSTLIRWDELTRNADLIRAKHIFFIMDACYGGLALTRDVGHGSARFLKDMMFRRARQVLTAGKADEVVSDSGGPVPNHSVFTGHLIEALQGKAKTPDGVITANSVMSYVYTKVAKDKNSNQTPHYGYLDGDGDMILLAPAPLANDVDDEKDVDRLISVPYAISADEVKSAASKIKQVKQLLASDGGTIELHDVLLDEVRRFIASTSDDSFAVNTAFSQADLVARLERYQSATLDLATMLACVSHWGKAAHFPTLQKCIARSCDRLEPASGLSVWLAMRWYPLLIELYCVGIAAVDAKRFDALAATFNTSVLISEQRAGSNNFLWAMSETVLRLNRSNTGKLIPGYEKHYTPFSDYLVKTLQPALDDTFFLGKDYELVFDKFELIFAMLVIDLRLSQDENAWGPIGRFGWKRNGTVITGMRLECEMEGSDWAVLRAGLFGGKVERFKKASEELTNIIGRLNWY